MTQRDLGLCNGCGTPLGLGAERGLCPSCQVDKEWDEINSPVLAGLRWLANRVRGLSRK